MEITFLCHNYYSLFLSFIYSRNIRSNMKDVKINLITSSYLQANMQDLNNFWDCVYIHRYIKFAGKNIFQRLKTLIHFYIEKCRIHSKLKFNDTEFLFTFKDTGLINREIIRLLNQKFGSKIILIEEGFALYSDMENKKKAIHFLSSTIGSLLLLPPPHHNTQGLNNNVHTILLKKEHLLPERKKRGKQLVVQSEKLFSSCDAFSYIQTFYGTEVNQALKLFSNIDILFIGQPVSDQGKVSSELEQNVLQSLFKCLGDYKILIKPHHLENRTKYDSALKMCPQASMIDLRLMNIPVEVLYCLLNTPIVITPWSSASINIRMINPDVFTFYLFELYHYPLPTQVRMLIDWYDGEKYLAVDSPSLIPVAISSKSGIIHGSMKTNEPIKDLYPELNRILYENQ